MRTIALHTQAGPTLHVPDSVAIFSTYVLLEQERWFEDETAFAARCVRPGETAIDVGANYGAYSTVLAHAVGPQGRVVAFEPAPDTAELLRATARGLPSGHIEVLQAAASAAPGWGRLAMAESPESRALIDAADATGEKVELATIDEALAGARDVSFLKVDAEGHELEAVSGARQLLRQHEPLVLFEIKAGARFDLTLARFLETEAGMTLFRLVPGLSLLAPYRSADVLDAFQLNLFACTPRRAEQLARLGLLAQAVDALASIPTATRSRLLFPDVTVRSDTYRQALDHHGAAQEPASAPSARVAHLSAAYEAARRACEERSSLPRLATLVRCALDLGCRAHAVKLLRQLMPALARLPSVNGDEPCLSVGSADPDDARLRQDLLETYERSRSFSSCLVPPAESLPLLDLICLDHACSIDMHRRRHLVRRLPGAPPHGEICDRLRVDRPDHLNSWWWRR